MVAEARDLTLTEDIVSRVAVIKKSQCSPAIDFNDEFTTMTTAGTYISKISVTNETRSPAAAKGNVYSADYEITYSTVRTSQRVIKKVQHNYCRVFFNCYGQDCVDESLLVARQNRTR